MYNFFWLRHKTAWVHIYVNIFLFRDGVNLWEHFGVKKPKYKHQLLIKGFDQILQQNIYVFAFCYTACLCHPGTLQSIIHTTTGSLHIVVDI